MAEIVRIETVCDKHQIEKKTQVKGETVTITIDGETIEIDWCPACKAQMTTKLLAELRKQGRPVNPKYAPKARKQAVSAASEPAAIEAKPTKVAASKNGKAVSKNGKRRKAPVDPDKPRRWPCIWCDWQPFTSNVGMMLHGQTKHGLTTMSTMEVFGTVCPLCGYDSAELGIGHHLTAEHGLTLPEAIIKASKEGDAYGVAATVLAKGKPLETQDA